MDYKKLDSVIFEIKKEDYVNLKICLNELLIEIACINEIEIENKKYNIIKFLGGDLKFLALFMGINSANSNYPCIWCKLKKLNFSRLM